MLEENSKLEKKLKKRDIENIKIIHDLKNPALAIDSIVQHSNIDNETKKSIQNEINELNDMLDILKTTFKLVNNLNHEEQKTKVNIHELFKSI